MNEDDLWRFSDGHFFSCPFLLSLLSFPFLLVIMFLFFLLCNIERAGLDLVVVGGGGGLGGISGSNHIMSFI